MTLRMGEVAPDFTLSDQKAHTHKLSDYRGQWVLLFFYPKDGTPGWIKEAKTLGKSYKIFQALNTKILGISADTVQRHERFAEKYGLPMTLLADPQKQTIRAYGTKGLLGMSKRMSFLVNPQGKIAKIYLYVKPSEHAKDVLNDLRELAQET